MTPPDGSTVTTSPPDAAAIEARYRELTPKSAAFFEESRRILAGARSGHTAPYPIQIERGDGPYLVDIDGRRYLNFWNAYNLHIFGHDNRSVIEAVQEQAEKGIFFQTPMSTDPLMARILVERVPSIEKVLFVNSGTEATLMASRVARAFTKRPKIAKMDGGYHGWHDAVMFNAGGVTATSFGGWKPGEVRAGLGVPEVLGSEVAILPFNDIDGCERVIREHRHELAAVIAEPLLTSAIIPAREGFLQELRELTRRYDILLILDEISSFGLDSGGGQGYYDITPDLTCVGKVIGGGMPIGAIGGRADIMDVLNPGKPPFIFASGTFSFHPLAMVAGAAYLQQLTPEVFTELHRKGDAFRSTLRSLFARIDAPMSVTGVGQFYALHCQAEEPHDWTSFMKGDRAMWSLVAAGLKNRGFWVGDGRGTLTMVNEDAHVADFVAALEESVSDAYAARGGGA